MALKATTPLRDARRPSSQQKRRKIHRTHECGTHDERVPPALAKYWDRTHAEEITHEIGTALEGAGPFLIAGATAIGPAERLA
jgi:hypothetical protein